LCHKYKLISWFKKKFAGVRVKVDGMARIAISSMVKMVLSVKEMAVVV
jgi:hypothetical protein